MTEAERAIGLLIDDATGEELGTAFVVPGGHALTALHVVGDRDDHESPIRHSDLVLQFLSGSAFATVKAWDADLDVALLATEQVPAGVELVRLTNEVVAGDWYRATGFFQLDPLATASSVSGLVSDTYWPLTTGVHALQLSCAEASAANPAVLGGLSGGPVCDRAGLAVGVVRRNPDPDGSGVAMGGIVMATRIADVLRRWPVELAPAVHRPTAEAAERRLRGLLRQLGPKGAPPSVRVADPHRAGVKRTVHDNDPGGAPYVPRHIDKELVAALGASACVIVTGLSNAGKSRAAWQAAIRSMPDSVFIAPQNRAAIVPLLADDAAGIGNRPALVWLDELREFIADGSGGGLDANVLDEVVRTRPHWRLLGTWRDDDRDQVTEAREFGRGARDLLDHDGVKQLYLPLVPVSSELRQAELMYPAENFAREVGIGEHLTAAPELLRDYERREQEDPLAWALVRAAADWRRVGMNKPIPVPDLLVMASAYARSKGVEDQPSADVQSTAWRWAFHRHSRSDVALLNLVSDGGRDFVSVLDQVADREESRRTGPSQILMAVWKTAVSRADREDMYGLVRQMFRRGDAQVRVTVARAGLKAFREEALRAGFFADILAGAFYKLGEPERALTIAKAVLTIGTPGATAHCLALLGSLYADRDDLATAREYYERAIATRHGHTVDSSLQDLAALAERDLDPDARIAAYRRAAEDGSTNGAWTRWRLLAHQCAHHGRNAEAAAANMKAAELAPSPADMVAACLNAGGQFLMDGDQQAAITALTQARRQDLGENSAEAAIVLGQLHAGAGRVAEAIEEYRYARRAGTANAAGRAGLYLAALHERQGELDPAERILRRAGAGEDDATAGRAWVRLANLAHARGESARFRQAIDQARLYIGVLPEEEARELGDFLAGQGDHDAALEAYRQAVTTAKDQEYASTVSLATMHAKLGDLPAAISVLRDLAGRSTAEIRGWCLYELARLLSSPEERLTVYGEAAATGFSEAGWAKLAMAAILLDDLDDYGRATEILTSLRDEPVPRTRATALLMLARIESRAGDTTAAKADYAAVIATGHYACVVTAGRNLGLLLKDEGDSANAAAALRAAVDAVPAGEPGSSRAGPGASGSFTNSEAADAAQILATMLKSDNAAEAEALYQRVRASAFDRPGGVACWGLAEITRDRDDYPMAVYYFREACDRLLRSDKVVANSAAVAWQKLSSAHDDTPGVVEAAKAITAAAQPGFALPATFWLAKRAVKAGDHARAREVLENAIETLPSDATAQAWLQVGDVYTLESDAGHAEAAYQRAIRLGDQDTALAAGNSLGILALTAGDYPRAESAFRAATGADDRDVAAVGWSSLGDMALQQGRLQAAQQFWDKAITVASEPGKHGTLLLDEDELTHRAHYALGSSMIDADLADLRAREHLRAVLAHAPCEHTASAGLLLGQAEVMTGEPALALTSFSYVTESADDEVLATTQYLRGWAHTMMGDLDAAEIAYRKAASSGIKPWADIGRVNLAGTFVKRGRLAEARGLAEGLLSNEDPEVVAAAQCTLGEVSGRQGELDDALRWLSLAADSGVADQRTEALFLRGELLTESGDAAGARAAYAELLLEEDEATVAKAAQALEKLDGKSTRQ